MPAPSPKRGAHWRKNFALPASIRPSSTPASSSDTRLGLDHAALAAAGARALDAAERAAIAALAARRLKREPVARIVGRKEFWSLPLRVDAATLVPRPETETVVEAALAAIDSHGPRAGVGRIADLGTGSGALLLALLTELPNATGIGTDTSLGALAVARDNARRLGLSRAQFVACDMAAALGGPFDLIVSNPPYIASGAIAALDPRGARFRPTPGAGRRTRRSRLLSGDRGQRAGAAPARRRACRRTWRRSGRSRRRLVFGGGACAGAAPPRSWGCASCPAGEKGRGGDGMSVEH